jgi:hypothetical protein
VLDAPSWQRDVLYLWRGARHREERYAAIELSGDKRARAFQTLDALPMYEEIIVTGAWWDYVDAVATHRLDLILRAEPRAMKKAMLAWSRSDDLWKRRSAILCQITFKAETDLDLLDWFEGVLPAQSDRMGAATVRVDQPARSRALRTRARGRALPTQQARGLEERVTARQPSVRASSSIRELRGAPRR